MSGRGETAAAVVIPLMVIIAAVIIFIYFYYRKKKRFPWQKDRGTPYTAPVAHYHEIENTRSQKHSRNDYDYAEPEVVFTNLGRGSRNNEEYDHLRDKVTTSHSQYDTTASAAQEITRSQSQETTTNSRGQYQSLNDKGESKVLHNTYEVVITPGQTPRSPDGNKGSSPGYSYLTAPQKQTIIRSEYDIANSQPSLSAEDEASASGETESCKNKPNKPVPKKRLLTAKSKAPEGNGTYEMANAPAANDVSSRKTKTDMPESNGNYELAKVPGANSGSSRKTQSDTPQGNRSYELAKLPRATNSPRETKSDTPEGNRSYELAKLPSATNASRKTKSDTAGSNKRFDLGKIANSAYTFFKEKNISETLACKLHFKNPFSDARNDVNSIKSDDACDETTPVGGAVGQSGVKAKLTGHAMDGGYVVTRLVNQRPDDVIDETRVYDSPGTDGSLDSEHNADGVQHYSLAGPCQAIYDRPDTK